MLNPALQLFDTMQRKLLPLRPSDGKTFRFYCCGPTVYGPAHIGNFRTFVMQDVLRRVLELNGMPTEHVRNITDVDDKTIKQSQAEGKKLADFTAAWTTRYHYDCQQLNLLTPHVEPSAVEHIPEQITLIEQLVKKGHAYHADEGSVYFDVSSFPAYGALSRLSERTITTQTTVEPSALVENADEYQRDSAADFALWKARKPEDGENFWSSPWGEGRPGWHIECSAMAIKHLGQTLDLHSGGEDLVFPHHENEIAQSEAATSQTFSRHWFHVRHLLVEGRKMSKSEGSLYTLEDLIAKNFQAMELRYVLIAGHYHKPLNFTLDSLSAARQALQTLFRLDEHLREAGGGGGAPSYQHLCDLTTVATATDNPFAQAWAALLDDLNTPEALGHVFVATKEIEAQLRRNEISAEEALRIRQEFQRLMQALGLILNAAPEAAVPAEIQALAQERWEAKQAKEWKRADELRARLTAAGWVMQDGKDGFTLVAAV